MSRVIINVLLEPADIKLLKRMIDVRLAIDECEGILPVAPLGVSDLERAKGVAALLDAHLRWEESA